MNVETAMIHLAAYREGKATDPRLSKAMRCIENESSKRASLAEQVAFDVSVMEMLNVIAAPVDLRHRLEVAQGTTEKPVVRSRHHLTAILSLGLGAAIILAVVAFLWVQNRKDFPGKENLVRIAQTPNRMSGVELDLVSTSAGELGDQFYMRGYEGYRLPPELRSLPAVGWRLFRPSGSPVAQVAIEEHHSLLYVLKAADFGVILDEDWTIFPAQGFVAAARQYENSVAMITFQGTEAEMEEFIRTLKSNKRPTRLKTP